MPEYHVTVTALKRVKGYTIKASSEQAAKEIAMVRAGVKVEVRVRS